jgi:hypothetical protein
MMTAGATNHIGAIILRLPKQLSKKGYPIQRIEAVIQITNPAQRTARYDHEQ